MISAVLVVNSVVVCASLCLLCVAGVGYLAYLLEWFGVAGVDCCGFVSGDCFWWWDFLMFELVRFWVFVSGFAVGFCWLRCGLLFVVLNFGLVLGECGWVGVCGCVRF